MKIAICVSGLTSALETHSWDQQMSELIKYFPEGDIFTGVWESDLSKRRVNYTHEFEDVDMDYNPGYQFLCKEPHYYSHVKKLARQKPDLYRNRTKQIIIHSCLLQKIPEEYDMIIRARYDLVFNGKPDVFKKLIERSYSKDMAIGVCTPRGKEVTPNLRPAPIGRTVQHLVDNIIFHPRHLLDFGRVLTLHSSCSLLPAEWGWYQVLSEPYLSNHECYFGSVGLLDK